MSGLVLFVIAVLLIIGGEGKTVLWVAGIFLVLFVIAAVFGKGKGTSASSSERPRARIDHPHYISDDEYECSICGTRFRSASMVCPHCGVRFNCTRKDEREYDDELEEELWMDEMDEEDGR